MQADVSNLHHAGGLLSRPYTDYTQTSMAPTAQTSSPGSANQAPLRTGPKALRVQAWRSHHNTVNLTAPAASGQQPAVIEEHPSYTARYLMPGRSKQQGICRTQPVHGGWWGPHRTLLLRTEQTTQCGTTHHWLGGGGGGGGKREAACTQHSTSGRKEAQPPKATHKYGRAQHLVMWPTPQSVRHTYLA